MWVCLESDQQPLIKKLPNERVNKCMFIYYQPDLENNVPE